MAMLAAGRDAALNNLMERHGEKLFHYLVRTLQDEAEAADVQRGLPQIGADFWGWKRAERLDRTNIVGCTDQSVACIVQDD